MTDIRKWHKGPPPFQGWWNASCGFDPHVWRWWNGQRWSMCVYYDATAEKAAEVARVPSEISADLIEWTEFWPEGARVPRNPPRRKLK